MASRPALYAHPFSSYSQKVLIALYENDIPFEYRNLESEEHRDALARLWPLRRFPVLVDDGRTIVEATQATPHLPGRGHTAIRMLTPRQEEILRLLDVTELGCDVALKMKDSGMTPDRSRLPLDYIAGFRRPPMRS